MCCLFNAINFILGFICGRKCKRNRLDSAMVDNTELVPPLYEDPEQVVIGDIHVNTTSNVAYGQVSTEAEAGAGKLLKNE